MKKGESGIRILAPIVRKVDEHRSNILVDFIILPVLEGS